MNSSQEIVETARRRKTRTMLIDAARAEFTNNGFHGTALESITERAGFTRGAFYSNFDSKESLFLALMDRESTLVIERLRESIDGISDDTPQRAEQPGREEIARVASQLIKSALAPNNSERAWYLLQEEFRMLALRDAKIAQRIVESIDQIKRELALILSNAMAIMRLRITIDPLEFTGLLLAMYEAATREELLISWATRPSETGLAAGITERAMVTIPPLVLAFTEFDNDVLSAE